MISAGMFEAKTHFSQLIEMLMQGKTDVVQIMRRNRPVAQITLIDREKKVKIGSCKGKWKLPDWDVDKAMDRELETMFMDSVGRPIA